MLVSGNDAAIALAVHVSGNERRFVRLMNEKARLWGLRCTRFASSHGLEDGNRSCAADLAVLTRLAMRNDRIARIVRRPQVSFRFPIKGGRLFLAGHNPLIRAGYRGRDRAEDRLHRRRRALLRRRRAPRRAHARRWCCWTHPTRSSTRRSCWTWASQLAAEVLPRRAPWPPRGPRPRRRRAAAAKPVNGRLAATATATAASHRPPPAEPPPESDRQGHRAAAVGSRGAGHARRRRAEAREIGRVAAPRRRRRREAGGCHRRERADAEVGQRHAVAR